MCNTYIKFGFIYEYAIQHGFDYVATGHYAQNVNNQLKRGYDANKDQSYFLWNVPKEKFEHILFPIGHLKKEAVRTIAQKNKLFTAEKKDSQGLCFIGPIDMKSFLKQLIITKKGDVRTIDGKVIGTHEGVELYTIGERHGFTIVSSYKTPNNKPLFVIDKDISNNILIVDIEPPHVKEIILDSVQIHDHEFLSQNQPTVIQVQFRYRQSPISAIYTHTNTQHKLTFEKPITNFIALGQSAVFYNKETCVGGGIIQKMVY
jgi:tRNA-specific 2-thiouridylase